jgi:hypothetical protein
MSHLKTGSQVVPDLRVYPICETEAKFLSRKICSFACVFLDKESGFESLFDGKSLFAVFSKRHSSDFGVYRYDLRVYRYDLRV